MMQALADFPIDPALIAAVEEALQQHPEMLVDIPQAWADARPAWRRRPSCAKRARQREHLRARHGNQCFYCGHEFSDEQTVTLDHLIPYVLVRNWDLKNLVLACEDCNLDKGSRVHAVLMPMLAVLVYRTVLLNASARKAVA